MLMYQTSNPGSSKVPRINAIDEQQARVINR